MPLSTDDQSVIQPEIRTPAGVTELEDGEIESDDECIMIEVEKETIVLDDDSYIQEPNEPVGYVTSTPYQSTVPCTTEKESALPYFLDTSRIPWFEVNKFKEDTPTTSKKKKNVSVPPLSSNSATQIIVIEDSIIDLPDKEVQMNDTADDSVMFISETPADPNFIPLTKEPCKKLKKPIEKAAERPCLLDNSALFTRREKTQLATYNSNLYNPHAGALEKTGKRTIIIDGCNVAFHHSRNKSFSVEGLKIAIEYFEKIGHDVKAVVPQYRFKWGKSSNQTLLEELREKSLVVVTPGKNLPNFQASSYDDRFILQLAVELDAAVISNDNYRDLIDENDAFKKVIENRVISYMWWGDIFVLAKDPYGRNGHPVEVILSRF